MKKKVGLVMACKGTSYGMNLQAFATQYIIERLGYTTEIVNISDSGNPFVFDLFLPVHLYKLGLRKIRNVFKKEQNNADDLHTLNYMKRKEAALEFRSKYLHGYTKRMSFSQMTGYAKNNFHAVLVGSDQVWLPGFSFTKFTSLLFVPDSVKRVAYSSSLGVSSYPRYCYHSARKAWMRFDAISVREESGKKIVETVCKGMKNVQVVIDPTYLITKEQWNKLIPERRMYNEKYVLCFILGNDEKQQLYVKRYAAKKRLKLVSILSNESESSIDTSFADETIVGAGPEDFINWIRGAEYVMTDSFHGIAFSVINEKQLFVFYRKRDDAQGKMSRNSRIDNILKMWNINNRLITNQDMDCENYDNNSIDYSIVNKLVESKREESLLVLSESLM